MRRCRFECASHCYLGRWSWVCSQWCNMLPCTTHCNACTNKRLTMNRVIVELQRSHSVAFLRWLHLHSAMWHPLHPAA